MCGDMSLANECNGELEIMTEWSDDGGGLFEMEHFSSGQNRGQLTGWTRHKGQEWPIWNFKLGVRQFSLDSEPHQYHNFGHLRLGWWGRLRKRIANFIF